MLLMPVSPACAEAAGSEHNWLQLTERDGKIGDQRKSIGPWRSLSGQLSF